LFGGNPDLKPERAKTWTAGLDVRPTGIQGLKAHVTYYNIRFDNEIVEPNLLIDTNSLFAFESVLGPSILQLNPSRAEVQNLASSPGFTNPFGITLSTIRAIFDSRLHNLSIVTTRGLDFGTSYEALGAAGTFDVGLDGTYILRFDNQVSAASPATSTLNTPYNPINLKMRAHASYTRGPLSLNAFINYINRYGDARVTPRISVASWTTADATIAYKLPVGFAPLRDTQITFAIVNIANRNPPLVVNDTWPVNYDGANANPLGRNFSLLVSKHW
jgi:outer membrane receptor protein involved in Fe transport